MPVPVIAFFNNKSGVGKTSLVYHLTWMLAETGHRVLACDLDPQANLSAAFLDEDSLECVWNDESGGANTVAQCVAPLMQAGDLRPPKLQVIASDFGTDLGLIAGDLALSGFEDTLSSEWPNALGSINLYRPFRILTAFSTIMQDGARQMDASVILADVGPNLGAINRSALIATDYVIVPLGADLFSLQGLRNLGPTLRNWRAEWQKRWDNWKNPGFDLPQGKMQPIGYVVQQHSVRLGRPVQAYDKWINRMPEEYVRNLLGQEKDSYPRTPPEDANRLATARHYRSLVPMAQEARKPIFKLAPADGAFGSHAAAVKDAHKDFRDLAMEILSRIENQ